MARHKWNGPSNGKGGRDGLVVACVKCGIVKQWVLGSPTYFDPESDKVFNRYAPPCDERLITDDAEQLKNQNSGKDED